MAEEDIDAQQDEIQEESEMTFWGRLEALRRHILPGLFNNILIFKTIIYAPKSS